MRNLNRSLIYKNIRTVCLSLLIGIVITACGKTTPPVEQDNTNAQTVSDNSASEKPETDPQEEAQEKPETDAKEEDKPKEPENKNPMAEDFTVYDMEGNEVKLSDWIGKPVIIYNWATWCPPCRSELPDFEEAYHTYGDMVVFAMIDVDTEETVEDVVNFMDMYGYTFPVYFDTDGIFLEERTLDELPVAYAIDPDGHLMGAKYGTLTNESLHDYINELLAY